MAYIEAASASDDDDRKIQFTRMYPKVSGLAAWSENLNNRAPCH
jgi:hypothetical protein